MKALNDTTTTESIELTTDADTADLVEAIEALAASNQQLAERVEQLESETQEQAARVDELETKLSETKADLDTVEDEVDDAQDDLEAANEHRSRMARDHAQTRGRVSDLESGIADLESDVASGEPTAGMEAVEESIQTPLERAVALSEEVAREELTRNQQRARWIAQNLSDYAARSAGGYVLASSDIKTVLAAMDESAHDETVGRVIKFFDDLGKEAVSVAKRRGSKRVLFTEALLQRLEEASDAELTTCVMGKPLEV